MVSSWPPRKCGIATFAEEAAEFIKKKDEQRPFYVVSHTDGEGDNVFPIIDMSRRDWYEPVAKKIQELDPYAVHIQHEYGLYNYVDENGDSDQNQGFLELLKRLGGLATIVEPHTVHGRLREHEENFVHEMTSLATVVLFKCHYQKWRLGWNFASRGWELPANIMIVPHGARPDKKYAIDEVAALEDELGLSYLKGKHVIGLVGWIQSNKRWDILTSIWEELHDRIKARTGEEWVLLAAGEMRDPNHTKDYVRYVNGIEHLAEKDIAYFHKFIPRGDPYYKVMAVCDLIVLPSLDETQSGTLARIIALNKPFVTTAPLEGLTAQTLESGGGLLFTNRDMLKKQILRLATDESMRWGLGYKLYRYLMEVVSWEVVAGQYYTAYHAAIEEKESGTPVYFEPEF